METYALIKVDCNDSDYKYSFNKISTCEEIDLIVRVSEAVANDENHRWYTNERLDKETGKDPRIIYKDSLTEDDIDFFEECFLPCDEYGIHTIKEIKLLQIESIEDLLRRKS